MSISLGYYRVWLLMSMILLSASVFASPNKKILINNQRVNLKEGYSLYVSGICRNDKGQYGLVQFQTSEGTIKTLACSPQADVKSNAAGFFAKIPDYDAEADPSLEITTPITSGRFYFYISKTAATPDWVIFQTTKADDSGNFGLTQPNIKNLLTNDQTVYPMAIIEITKDGPKPGQTDNTYYADGTLIDGVSPLFASITKTDGSSAKIVSGYTIPENIKTSDIIKSIISQCSNATPAKSLCQSFLTVAGKTDKLGNTWIIAPTEIGADKFSDLLDSQSLSYLKKLDGVSWAKSTYCGTFHIGDGSDKNCPIGTLCSTLGQYFNNTCFDKASTGVDAAAKQYPIMFNSSHAAKEGQACIVNTNGGQTSPDGQYWMESPCWDLRTVYSPAMPAATRNCSNWPKYGDLAQLDAFLAKGVTMTLTPAQQQSPERGYCDINSPTGLCKWSMTDCKKYIAGFNGDYTKTINDQPVCQQGGDPLKYLRCQCPATYVKKFNDTNPDNTLCKNPESINAITSWASVFLAATPDLSGEDGLLQKACTKTGVTLLTPECVAQYITAPKSQTILNTQTRYFSENYYAWLLQFLYVKDNKLTYPSYDSNTATTTVTETNKQSYLSGFGPTYVFAFSDFVSGDKALLTWGDNESSATIEIKLVYDVSKDSQ